MRVVLLCGKAGSGKSTTAAIIQELADRTGQFAFIQKFAAPLYRMHDAVLSIAKEYGISTLPKERELLQFLGADWGRELKGENVWVEAAINNLKRADRNAIVPTIAIFDDTRYPNEIELIKKEMGGNVFAIRLEASETTRVSRGAAGELESLRHRSECGLDQWDKFDLTINTENRTPFDVATNIWKEINK